MTVAITSTYARAAGNGVTTVFNFPFLVFAAGDIVVRDITDATGASATKTLTTDYSVTISATTEGGSITFVTAPAAAHTIDIRRTTPLTQPEDIVNQGRFLPELHEGSFDRLETQIQDLSRRVNSTIRQPDYEQGFAELPAASSRASKYVVFDSGGALAVIPGSNTDSFLRADLANPTTPGLGNELISYRRTPAEIAATVTPTFYFYEPGRPERYGADPTGVANSYAAFVSAFAVGGKISLRAGQFKISTAGLILDPSRTALIGDGASIDFTGVASGTCITLSVSTFNLMAQNSMRGIQFVGANVAGVRCLYFSSPSISLSGFNINGCDFIRFVKAAEIFTNCFGINFNGCTFIECGANGAIYTPGGGTNYGERITFNHCFFGNCTTPLKSDYQSVQYFCNACSFDYSTKEVASMQFGYALFSNCYLESNTDAAYWFDSWGTNATIIWNGGVIATIGVKTSFEIARANVTSAVVRIMNSKLYCSANANLLSIVAGTGQGYLNNNQFEGGINPGAEWCISSMRANLLANGDFHNGLNGLTYGTTTAGGNPTVSGGALVLQVSSSGSDQFAYFTVPAIPGENIGMTFQAKTNNVTAPFAAHLQAYGADGSNLGDNPQLFAENVFNGSTSQLTASFVTHRVTFTNLPAGTAFVRVAFDTNGATNSAFAVSVDNVVCTKW